LSLTSKSNNQYGQPYKTANKSRLYHWQLVIRYWALEIGVLYLVVRRLKAKE